MSASVVAGTYYIGVAGYDASVSGDYTISVRFQEHGDGPSGDDHGNSRATATRVTNNSSTSGNLTADDADFFAIKVRQSGRLSASTTGDTDTVGVLHDSRYAIGF